jgi:hypothetical protein
MGILAEWGLVGHEVEQDSLVPSSPFAVGKGTPPHGADRAMRGHAMLGPLS